MGCGEKKGKISRIKGVGKGEKREEEEGRKRTEREL